MFGELCHELTYQFCAFIRLETVLNRTKVYRKWTIQFRGVKGSNLSDSDRKLYAHSNGAYRSFLLLEQVKILYFLLRFYGLTAIRMKQFYFSLPWIG